MSEQVKPGQWERQGEWEWGTMTEGWIGVNPEPSEAAARVRRDGSALKLILVRRRVGPWETVEDPLEPGDWMNTHLGYEPGYDDWFWERTIGGRAMLWRHIGGMWRCMDGWAPGCTWTRTGPPENAQDLYDLLGIEGPCACGCSERVDGRCVECGGFDDG